MLVLTRKSGEKIIIGDDIVVTVLDVAGTQVRIGIEAPREIAVHRSEIYEGIQEENLLAAGVEAADFMAAEKLWRPQEEREAGTGRTQSED